MRVSCHQCTDGLVNADEKLVLTAEHSDNFLESELSFTWSMFIVADGNDLTARIPAGVHDFGKCVEPDGKIYWSYMNPSKLSTEEPSTMTKEVTEVTKGVESE